VIAEPTTPKVRATLRRLVRALRHPLRLALAGVAVAAAVAPLGSALVLASAVFGAAIGVVAGELLGRTPLRLPALTLVIAGAGGALGLVAWGLVGPALAPAALGPAAALNLATALQATLAAAIPIAWLRAGAARAQALAVVELAVMAALFVLLVATHRDGAISRPLWLSDLTWSLGVDPGRALLAGGVALAVALVALRLLDSGRRLPTVGLAWLPALALGGLLLGLWLGRAEEPLPERLLELQADGDEVAEGDDDRDRTAQAGADDGAGSGSGATPERGDGATSGGGATPERGDQPDGDGEGGGDRPDGEGGEGGEGGDTGDAPDSRNDEAPDPLEERDPGGGDSPMAVVLLDDDHEPVAGYWYLRQQVLSDYRGVRLLPSALAGSDTDAPARFPVAAEPVPGAPGRDGRAVVHGSVSLIVPHETPFALESPASLSPRGNPNPTRFVRSYSFVAHALDTPYEQLVGRPVGDPAWSDDVRALYLHGPTDPRYRELAESWIADLPEEARGDAVARGMVAAHPLLVSLKYTLRARYPDSDDPTAAFLFGPRVGYCVHSAHAAAFLWRSVGIPSRVATGYAVSDDERRGSVLLVRGAHAHAWPEIHVDGLGWIPLDIAPSEDLDASTGEPPSEDDIALLGDMARDPPPVGAESRVDLSWIWAPLRNLAIGLAVGLVVSLLLGHFAAKGWRRLRPALSDRRALPRTAYRAALDRLAEVGLSRLEGETREAFARRVGALSPAFADLTALHLRATLGPPDRPSDPADVRAALRRALTELRQTRPWWLRAAGLLDPTSIYRAR
jgi:protein-glutamine gamma-glutamyltransferase